MRRAVSLCASLVVLAALATPAAGAKAADKSFVNYAVAGEARALELALGSEGVTLGLALARADSAPSAIGVGAGQCTLLGDDPDPEELPCTEESKSQTRYPGSPGDGVEICGQTLPAALSDVVDLRIACGTSRSGLAKGIPFTTNKGRVAHLGVTLPVGAVLSNVPQVPLVDDLTETLAPVLDLAPDEVKDAVDNVLELVTGVAETEAVAIELAPATSNVKAQGSNLTVTSDSAGALIGVLGIPEASVDGTTVTAESNPLENGLLIIEVGRAQASATLNTKNAQATSAASPALITVKVRDITKPEPTYVEVSVAPGQTVTVLQGTPAESTITAADATTTEEGNSAAAAADAVRLHLLKGVNGGLVLGLGRATAAVNGEVVKPVPPVKKAPLPFTGGIDRTLPALGLIALALSAVAARRRFRSSL